MNTKLAFPRPLSTPHSCRKCYSECLNKLINFATAQEVMAFNQVLKDSFQGTKLKKMTETVDSEAYIVTEGHKTPTPVDTVVQLYSIDTHSASRVYYNLFACKYVSRSHLN
ncbi:hypothetical protein HPB48_022432 [Haemaphysalis longicornis]|uniref:Uncharacterized protein n=1 Tax=Haemaphysalis longicornis TaxID=44386 RepID=A0A9J6GGV2_HAELO|nr:hypothetical protein HPB48_022432 [Haemaphysalis longicornis]